MSVSSVSSYSFIDRMVMSAMNRSSKAQGQNIDFAQLASKIMKKGDTDKDGSLSASETKFDSDAFNKADANGDGKLSSDELSAGLQNNTLKPSRPSMGTLLAGLQTDQSRLAPPPMDASQMASNILQAEDTNGDSTLSVDETGLSSTDFKTLDTSGDGKVSAEELQAGLTARESERASERASMAQQSISMTSDKNGTLQSLLDALTQNKASNAYSDQTGIYQLLQSSSTQTLAITA